ncbi:MAG: DJ-1/PfpI family protein [Rhodobacterales bacterium]|nr:DJ-1/PfpI family protein [Rhodobacterales bacterium]
MITFGILAFDGMEELDAIGPYEVLGFAAGLKPDDARVVMISKDGGPVRCAKGLGVAVDHAFTDAPPLDVVIVPGGIGARTTALKDGDIIAWIAATAATATWTCSVCTGAFLLDAAGLTKGRRVTTYHDKIDLLRRVGTDVTVLDDVRYVRDGQVVTSAGVSAGMDMTLWLVGQIWDPAFARAVQRGIEYDPAPPYAAAV